jgi:hypothetical protein
LRIGVVGAQRVAGVVSGGRCSVIVVGATWRADGAWRAGEAWRSLTGRWSRTGRMISDRQAVRYGISMAIEPGMRLVMGELYLVRGLPGWDGRGARKPGCSAIKGLGSSRAKSYLVKKLPPKAVLRAIALFMVMCRML